MDSVQDFVYLNCLPAVDLIKKLSMPLKQNYGMSFFWYYWIDDNGSFCYLGNDACLSGCHIIRFELG